MADPYAAAIVAQLPPPGTPSPTTQRLAAGVVLLQQGMTQRQAAAAVGVPRSTLWAYYHGQRPNAGRHDSLAEAESMIEDISAEITLRASEKILEGIEADKFRPAELVKASQVARDTLAIRRRWQGQTPTDARATDALADALEAMRDKLRVDSKIDEATLITESPGQDIPREK